MNIPIKVEFALSTVKNILYYCANHVVRKIYNVVVPIFKSLYYNIRKILIYIMLFFVLDVLYLII